ncbi:helix-turn-helix domain-containing protein [Pediococcus pentosaceus]|uniref:helix-turn-helix domain-containing protein n=1 Tax=Pediococcus pentosaceus TaxID=1255 RepID=UPI0021A405C7|nr:transcriptional regulator [Pediococcus pentosaceus]
MSQNIESILLFLGTRTRELREYSHLSQEELAEKADLSLSLISKLERGQSTNITLSAILNITQALNIDLVDFLNDQPVQQLELQQLNYALKTLNHAEQKTAVHMFLEIINFKKRIKILLKTIMLRLIQNFYYINRKNSVHFNAVLLCSKFIFRNQLSSINIRISR